MYTLIRHSDSPPGGGRTVPRTVSRTALREALSNSPSGTKDRNYDLSTELHTYGVIYPAGLRRPELVPTGTQTAFRLYETISLGGRENARSCMACVRARMGLGLPYALLYIGKPRGRNVTQKTPKCPWHIPFQKGICHMGVPCGAPWWSSTLGQPPLGGGTPHEVPCPPSPSRRPFWNFQKGAFPKKSKSVFT